MDLGAAPILFALAALAILLATSAAITLQWRHDEETRAREAEIERLQERAWTLSELSERYRGLAEAGNAAIVQRDAAGRITFANEGFARLVGRPLLSLLGSEARPAVVESGAISFAEDGTRQVDEAIAPADGGPVRWFAWIETPAAGRDGAPEWLRAGTDVTERVATARSLEEARGRAEAASVAKSRFLATVSHEFRTPLNGILGMTALMLETPLSPEQTTYARAVQMSGGALLSLIDEILDFSKIEAGKVELAAEPFDLAALVEGVVELLAPRAQDKGIEIAGFYAADLPRRIVGDAERVRQILLNLAGNAVKFTDAGGVGVSVAFDQAGIVLEVADTGPGIPEERIPALFEEFEQGDGSASRRHEGTGLGLAITRRLVHRMGGTIAATSRLGSGTTFRVTLPLPSAEAPADRPTLPGVARVLVVARSPYEAPFIARRLGEAGVEVVEVADETEAATRLALGGFAAVIADRGLGDAVVRAVAAHAREANVAKSLVLLSPFERRDFGAPEAAGFDGFLVKPVRARSLFTQLAEAVPQAPPITARVASAPAEMDTVSVLLAEDNDINALLATRALERLGARVTLAKDGLAAVERAREALEAGAPPDLVLMDIRMPGIDGVEALRRVRALPRGDALRIIALTANALSEDRDAARDAGFDGFLAKPLDIKALPALLRPHAAAA